MTYFSWYFIANTEVPEYKINSSGLKLIVAKYKGKAQQRDQGKRIRVVRLHEYEALSADSEVEPEGLGETGGRVAGNIAD